MKWVKLLSLIIIGLSSTISFAAQTAIVTSQKATIYADMTLQSPIGYVKQSKILAVGDVKRRHGKILPVVVNGRIGWIETKDIRLPAEQKKFDLTPKLRDHEVFSKNIDIPDPFDENNYLTVWLAPTSAQVSGSSDLSENYEEDLDTSTELSLMYEHKNPFKLMHWGVGLDYFSASHSELSFQNLSLKMGLSFVPIRLSWVSFELYGNLLLSADFRVETNVGTYKGIMYGLDYGLAARLFPEYKIGLIAGIGFTNYQFSSLGNVQSESGDDIENLTIDSLSGSKAFLGLSYLF